jgi:hypothetical protein
MPLQDFTVTEYFEHVNGGVGSSPRVFSGRLKGKMSMEEVVDSAIDYVVLANNSFDPTWYFDLKGRRKFELFSPYPFEHWRRSHLEEECIDDAPYGAVLLRVWGSYGLSRHRSFFSREGVYAIFRDGRDVHGVMVDFLESRWGRRHGEELHFNLKDLSRGVLAYELLSSQMLPQERQVLFSEVMHC